MKKTAQFGLNQWEMSDRIQMQDFNRDNAAIEAALGTRNCQFYTASYVGDGQTTLNLTFPHKPMILFITRNGWLSEAVYVHRVSIVLTVWHHLPHGASMMLRCNLKIIKSAISTLRMIRILYSRC